MLKKISATFRPGITNPQNGDALTAASRWIAEVCMIMQNPDYICPLPADTVKRWHKYLFKGYAERESLITAAQKAARASVVYRVKTFDSHTTVEAMLLLYVVGSKKAFWSIQIECDRDGHIQSVSGG
jgi:hypothetical protein